ncbi:MAG: hypothetical protein WD623_01965 [Marinobacter sp.]|uniref:hypothetical protein n=1 Tax=Marinobacter sp. TaxID=50741 RepID=UPI0034A07BCF
MNLKDIMNPMGDIAQYLPGGFLEQPAHWFARGQPALLPGFGPGLETQLLPRTFAT